MALSEIPAGNYGLIKKCGQIKNPAWSLQPGQEYYLGKDGDITDKVIYNLLFFIFSKIISIKSFLHSLQISCYYLAFFMLKEIFPALSREFTYNILYFSFLFFSLSSSISVILSCLFTGLSITFILPSGLKFFNKVRS